MTTFPSLITSAAVTILAANLNAAGRPNFVFIQGEGQGWNSLSIEMDERVPSSKSDFFHTPNLAALALEGMRFSRFYAPSPRCTPSRAAYLTGKSPAQLRITYINREPLVGRVNLPPPSTELPLGEITIAEHLKTGGYATAHFGKWHVGRANPSQHGFDESDGPNGNAGPGRNPKPNPDEAYRTTDLGIDFMNRQVRKERPFFLQISHYPGRSALDAKPETLDVIRKLVGRRDERFIGAAAVALDADINVGRIAAAIDRLGIRKTTYVFYTADHGTPGRGNGPLANGKGSVKEGGLRVPMIFRGPGIEPGSFATTLTQGMDLFPTIAELAGIKSPLPSGIEGGSFAAILRNGGKGSVRRPGEEFVAHFPHYDGDPLGPATAIYSGHFKLIHAFETGQQFLYNLTEDLGEEHDLAARLPTTTEELSIRLFKYLKSVKAQTPTIDRSKPIPTGDACRGDRPPGGKKNRKGREQRRLARPNRAPR